MGPKGSGRLAGVSKLLLYAHNTGTYSMATQAILLRAVSKLIRSWSRSLDKRVI